MSKSVFPLEVSIEAVCVHIAKCLSCLICVFAIETGLTLSFSFCFTFYPGGFISSSQQQFLGQTEMDRLLESVSEH